MQPERTRVNETADSNDVFDNEADEADEAMTVATTNCYFLIFSAFKKAVFIFPISALLTMRRGTSMFSRAGEIVSGCFRKKTRAVLL